MPAGQDPRLSEREAKALADLYSAAVATLLRGIARRLARGITTPGWEQRKLLQLVDLRREAIRTLDQLDRRAGPVIRSAVDTGVARGATVGARDVPGIPARPGPRANYAAEALARDTVGRVGRMRGGILRQVDDVYRQVISEAAGLPVTGVRTRQGAAQQALDRFAMSGITGFRDKAGRNWSMEAYSEMALRTAVGRAQVEGAIDRLQAGGRDLVIVSISPDSCPVCAPHEDTVKSITGDTPGYPTLAEAQADGLLHVACTHRLHAWTPGLTQQVDDTGYDPQDYEDRQEQRRLERGLRTWKQREAVAMTPEAAAFARGKAREWSGRLRAHTEATGRVRVRARESLGAR